MRVISSVSSIGVPLRGYNEEVLAEVLREQSPDKIFLTEIMKDDGSRKGKEFRVYERINNLIQAELVPVGVDLSYYDRFREKFLVDNLTTPELSIKLNMLDLIEDTISNYLAQYWKGPDTVNSEVTDSLFRAKHKLFASVFFEMEAGYWENRNSQILENIRKENPSQKSVLITSVESRYWFNDRLSDIL